MAYHLIKDKAMSFLHKQCNKFDAISDITLPFFFYDKKLIAMYCTNFLFLCHRVLLAKFTYTKEIQDSRLLYYFIREIKMWLNNHFTVHKNTLYILKLKEVIENTKFTS